MSHTTIASAPRATVVAVTSGKGGVGKTNVAVNVAVSLARLGYRVGVLDADFGLGNIDVLLGLTPSAHVGHVVAGEKALADVVVQGPLGVRIIPASSGLQSLTALSATQRARLTDALDEARRDLDFLFIDTAAGISDNVLQMLTWAGRVVIVTSLEPSAIVDAYAVTKVLSTADATKEIGVVVNGVRTADEAGLAFRQIQTAARRFLGRHVAYYGYVCNDPAMRDALLEQRALVECFPESPASRCYRVVASRLAGLGPVSTDGPRPLAAHSIRTDIPADIREDVRADVRVGILADDATEVPQCA
jgi:flagellar biosynthesis protein FlhG